MDYELLLLLAFAAAWCGVYAWGKRNPRFSWNRYILILIPLVLWSLSLMFFYGIVIVYLFLASAVVGFVLEYALGRTYHRVIGERLWTYGTYSIDGYTSWLTLPMWGAAGVRFWHVGNLLGP